MYISLLLSKGISMMRPIKLLLTASALLYLAAVIFAVTNTKTLAYVAFILGSLFLVVGRSLQTRARRKEDEKETEEGESV